MSALLRLATSTIGKKIVMALTGLALIGFLVAHLAGNLLLYVGQGAYNSYAQKLAENPLLVPAELGLLAVFVIHILLAIRLTCESYVARPQGYAMHRPKGGRNLANRSMLVTGAFMLVFVVWHLSTFKYVHHTKDALNRDDFYTLVIATFHKPQYLVGYILAMALLGAHVSHGFLSAFRSGGLNHIKVTPAVELVARLIAVAFFVGFASIPVWAYMRPS